jgi:YidC/Oxa1 family membrane protein insertase
MFTTIIVKPIFNLLVLVYALLPGHNFGLSLIIFTIIVRLLLWPLVKKQLHQAKAMRDLQPEIKRIKKAAKKDRAKESQMMMELYKERGINPFSTFPILIVQLIVLIGLYSGLRKVIHNPDALVTFAYPGLQHLSWMKHLAKNIHGFDDTLFGVVNLGKSALSSANGVYWPAMVIVLGSAIAQYFQSKQLIPTQKDQRSLRQILKDAGKGKEADQSEVNAAVGRSTRYFLPVMIFLFTVNLASALSLYWLTGGIVAYIQQSLVLRKDETEMEVIADTPSKDVDKIPEAEIVETKAKARPSQSKKAKRRKKR